MTKLMDDGKMASSIPDEMEISLPQSVRFFTSVLLLFNPLRNP